MQKLRSLAYHYCPNYAFFLSFEMLSKLASSLKQMVPDGFMRESIAKNGLVWLQKSPMLSKLKTISQKERIYLNSFICKRLHHRNIILFGHVCKKSNFIPPKLRNIDKDADWGKSEYKGWVFGYKTHLVATSSFHKVAVPLYCEITPANNSDCPTAKGIFKNFWPERIKYLLADKGYDDKTLRSICQRAKSLLITPMKRYKHMNPERKSCLKFYRSKAGRKRYSQRAKTIEPLIGHIKELFNTEKLQIKGLKNVQSFLSLCVWIYQTLIYYNFIYQRPMRRLKDLVCAL